MKCPHIGSCVSRLGLQLEVLFGDAMEPLGGAASLEEGCHWGRFEGLWPGPTSCAQTLWPASFLLLPPCVFHYDGFRSPSFWKWWARINPFSTKLLFSGCFITATERKWICILSCFNYFLLYLEVGSHYGVEAGVKLDILPVWRAAVTLPGPCLFWKCSYFYLFRD